MTKSGAWRWWFAVALACAVPALPLLTVEIPPLVDYPNHLARMWFLGTQTADPVLSTMLAPHWALLPNLGADAVLPWVMRVLPVHVVGRLFLAVLLVVPVLGAVALSRTSAGGDDAGARCWALGTALVTCNGMFLLGFLNFDLAYGLAMLAGACWFRFRESRPLTTAAFAVVAVSVLFFCHLLGAWFFLLLAGSCEAERCWVTWQRSGSGTALREAGVRAAMLSPAVLVAGALYVSTALHEASGPPVWDWGARKAYLSIYPVLNYNVWLDGVTAALLAGVLLAGLATGRLVVPIRWRLVMGTLLVLFLAMPFVMKGLAFVDARFSVLLGFSVFAGMRPVRVPRRVAIGLCAAGVLLLGVRTAYVAQVWRGSVQEFADLRRVIAPVQPGSRVLVVRGDDPPSNAGPQMTDHTTLTHHRAALLLLERRAFWPAMFADPAQQPVRWLEPYATLAKDSPGLPYAGWLSGAPIPIASKADFPLEGTWMMRYDDVLLIEIGGQHMDRAKVGGGWLELVADSPTAALFRVRRHQVLVQASGPMPPD